MLCTETKNILGKDLLKYHNNKISKTFNNYKLPLRDAVYFLLKIIQFGTLSLWFLKTVGIICIRFRFFGFFKIVFFHYFLLIIDFFVHNLLLVSIFDSIFRRFFRIKCLGLKRKTIVYNYNTQTNIQIYYTVEY